MIEKISTNKDLYKREYSFYNSAREGWADILAEFIKKFPEGDVLLPAYIGWSANEGSGIFDPVRASGIPYSFYKINRDFKVDFEDLKAKCSQSTIVLLVHYFGFIDPSYHKVSQWLKQNQIVFIEDCAHALLSDYIGGACGRRGVHSFYSLHKLLPIPRGGMIASNNFNSLNRSAVNYDEIWQYDLKMIYDIRRANYQYLLNHLKKTDRIKVIYPDLPEGIGPQTLPVLLERNRDKVYHEMNSAKFGMVSLYHTMINEISEDAFPDSHYLAQHIINFPVHQDIAYTDIDQMIYKFEEIYKP